MARSVSHTRRTGGVDHVEVAVVAGVHRLDRPGFDSGELDGRASPPDREAARLAHGCTSPGRADVSPSRRSRDEKPNSTVTVARVETVYRTEARSVPRSVMSSDDQRSNLHAELLAEATVGIARSYGGDATPTGSGVVQIVEELSDGRVSVLLTVAVRRRP